MILQLVTALSSHSIIFHIWLEVTSYRDLAEFYSFSANFESDI